jgi:hypothetical protein
MKGEDGRLPFTGGLEVLRIDSMLDDQPGPSAGATGRVIATQATP